MTGAGKPDQPRGPEVPGWSTRPAPGRVLLEGSGVALLPLTSAHYAELYAATCDDPARWTYLPAEMPRSLPDLWMLLAERVAVDPATWAVVPRGGTPLGMVSLMAAAPEHGSVELGWVLFGAGLQGTAAGTEAVRLVQRHVFDELGYRRLEWKCDSRNERSRRAAARFGFTFEGTFRQHRVVKGRNRDTDWFAITDAEWRDGLRAQQA